MGNSSNKSKEWSATNRPIIKLKVDKKEPKFNATEAVKIRITAECHNVTIPKNGLEYEWSYVDSTGFMKFFKTKKGVVMLHCPNFFCGRVMTVKVKVNLKAGESDEKMKFSSFDSGKFDILEDTIEIKPRCDKKLADNADWLPEEAEMPNRVQSSVTVHGYNGSELGLVRLIKEKGKIIWKSEDKVMVQDNVVSALFNRNHCTSNTTDDSTYTLQFQLTNARNGSLLKSYSRDYTIKGHEAIKPLSGCPIQPVMVGDVTIQENNYKPCKYTQIDVEYTKDSEGKEKQKVTVFKEGGQSKNTVNIIGGKREVTVTLLEYTPDKCSSHNNKKAILKGYNIDSDGLPINIIDGKISKEFEYQYNALTSICVWPISEVSIQKYQLEIATCRHTSDILINHYPDVKWALNFKCEMLEKKQKGDKREFKFELSATHGYDDFELEGCISNNKSSTITIKKGAGSLSISNDIQKSFRQYIEDIIFNNLKIYSDLIKSTVEFVDKFKELFDEASEEFKAKYITGNALNKTYEKDFPKQRKTISMELILPQFEIGLEWKPTTYNNQVGMLAKVKGEGTVIGGQLTVDLLAILGKLGPGAKAFMATIDFTLWLFDAEVKLDLVFKLEMTLKGEFAYNGAKQDTQGFVKAIGTPGVSIKGEFTYKSSENIVIKTADGKEKKQKQDVEKGYGIEGKGEFPITFEIAPTPTGYDGVLSGKFGGLEITCYAKVIVKKNSKGTLSKPQNESKPKGQWMIIERKTLFGEKRFNLLEK